MAITIYHFPPSAPSRCAVLVAKALGLDVDIKVVNLFDKEQLKPDFVKINPQHVVPTLTDGDFTIWESRAIATYLANSYEKGDKLYPKDPKARALVDQRLQFCAGTLYPRIRAICFPVLFLGEIEVEESKKSSLEEAIGFLDIFLDENDFVTGNTLTIADISIAASLSSIIAVGWDVTAYANVAKWFAKCTLEIPGYMEINDAGAQQFGKAVKSKLAPGQI